MTRHKQPEINPGGLNQMGQEAIRAVLTEIVETARYCHNTPELRLEIERRIRVFLADVVREAGPYRIDCSEPDDPKSGQNSRRLAVLVQAPSFKTSKWANPDMMIVLDPSLDLEEGASQTPSWEAV